jgi:hypothetical protein
VTPIEKPRLRQKNEPKWEQEGIESITKKKKNEQRSFYPAVLFNKKQLSKISKLFYQTFPRASALLARMNYGEHMICGDGQTDTSCQNDVG